MTPQGFAIKARALYFDLCKWWTEPAEKNGWEEDERVLDQYLASIERSVARS